MGLTTATWRWRLMLGLLLSGCGGGEAPPKAPPPATVANPPKESALGTVTLTEDAERRLGIGVTPVARRSVPETRTLGGEVVVPPGLAITVTAPVAGVLLEPTGGVPGAGGRLERGAPVFWIVSVPSDLSRAREDAEVTAARARLAATRAARASELARDGLATQDEADAAVAEARSADAAAEAARARLRLLTAGVGGDSAGLTPLQVGSPVRGVLRRLLAAAGQTVASGTALFEVARLDSLWVRVPVYVGEASHVMPASARVRSLEASPGEPGFPVAPVAAPPSADPLAASADLFYAVDNRAGRLRPGERVAVEVPLRGGGIALVVPWSAVVLDVQGGAWVYARSAPHTYVRRRVSVARVVGDLAVLERGPAEGTPVVTTGVAELYGTEFGNGK